MSSHESPIKPAWERYLEAVHPQPDPLLAEMVAFASQHGLPVVSPDVGRLLALLVTLHRPGRLVECGTCIGVSTLYMARALREADIEGRIDTLDPSKRARDRAARFLARDQALPWVELHPTPAKEYLAQNPGPIDLLFIDAVKQEYTDYLELALPRMPAGALLVVDNLLWHGHVAGKPVPPDDMFLTVTTEAIARFNEQFLNHPRLKAQILPLGDGTGLAVVR